MRGYAFQTRVSGKVLVGGEGGKVVITDKFDLEPTLSFMERPKKQTGSENYR